MGVTHLSLFGSWAKGRAHEGSDVDLLAELAPNADISIIQAQLESSLGRKVDLIEHSAAPPAWSKEIDQSSIMIF